jgi:transposase InsO family protein
MQMKPKEAPLYLVRDRDSAYGDALVTGIRDRPITARSPWQNSYAERLIGSIRRDCLDHVVVFDEQHLHHLLISYQTYYNQLRTHLSLKKDTPISRDVRRAGRVHALPILAGLHHQYVRV